MGDLVDLVVEGAKQRPADVRATVEIWRTEDGSVVYSTVVEEYVVEGKPELRKDWIRASLREGILRLSRRWRMGLARRGGRRG